MLQELKGAEFPALHFKELGYESVAVAQKAYNGVAILSRHPILTVSTTLAGDDADSHARYLEAVIGDLKIVNIYLPNGNPPGSDNFAYKLAWMDRLHRHLQKLAAEKMPVVVGGEFAPGHRIDGWDVAAYVTSLTTTVDVISCRTQLAPLLGQM